MAVVESEGRITNVETAPYGGWAPQRSLRLYTNFTADYATIYKTQPAVRTVVDFLARNIAQLGIHTFRRVSDTDRERLTDHPLTETLDRPNRSTTPFRLFRDLISDIGVYDLALWIKVRGKSQAINIVRVPPDRVSVMGDNWLRPEFFRITGNKGYADIQAADVVYFRGYSPSDPREGVAPIETLRRILAEEAASGEYRENFWRNSARMETLIVRPKDAPQWSGAARERFRADWDQRYAGPEGSGKTAILEDGMDAKPMSFSAKDAQYIETRKLTREEVAAAYHIAPTLVGILEHATFSNIESQHRQLYQDTMGPWLQMIEQEIELQLLTEFSDTEDIYVEFNLAEKLKGSFEEQAKAIQTLVGGPIMVRNEGRSRINLPSLGPEGDQIITPLNVMVGGQASPTDSAPKAQLSEAHLDQIMRFLERQKSSIASRIGAALAKGDKPNLEDLLEIGRWYRELTDDLTNLGG